MRRLFLGRDAYRQRRLGDAIRVLPVLFAVLAVLPPVWLPQYFSYARGAVWLAASWALTIAATAVLHRAIGRAKPEDEDDA
ncbi:hypothetical protein EQ718_23215 (plasmid) [Paracoccus versutus]|uniref:DUF3311 domain-containing protein n=1 Tax=Paracoccus versutus TaxID=34007 RepID=A0A3E0CE03_PARVE|nr:MULTISPECIES: hypothetical protein [Paracoccus]WGR63091.1 hypothetical protein E3U26_20560 [Paracoccus ferrooxidans]SFX02406.1 hypothetical protein SAMN04244548_00110 [Paracoccus pantotrophus]KGJ10756.1 hypothetical protein IT40_10010 [Paracoccus versutus]MBT0780866.1 hypothetical protein [Paracoccus sp. pheM1]MCJ1899932.1 hypothetical protein [Paracoccus versutus]